MYERRFRFGRNWRSYARGVGESEVQIAERSLIELVDTLDGRSFLDIGSGSGLFSLAALGAGAERVFAFDYDPDSVATTERTLERHAPGGEWTVTHGDVLDRDWIAGLGKWDVVYAWGVLHHTGEMWLACENAVRCVREGGMLAIALYNDQGWKSHVWTGIKWLYVHVWLLRPLLLLLVLAIQWGPDSVLELSRGRNPLQRWRAYGSDRGMDAWHDVVDWTGGYPFETATPEEVTTFFRSRGFQLVDLRRTDGPGNNEFVFIRSSE